MRNVRYVAGNGRRRVSPQGQVAIECIGIGAEQTIGEPVNFKPGALRNIHGDLQKWITSTRQLRNYVQFNASPSSGMPRLTAIWTTFNTTLCIVSNCA